MEVGVAVDRTNPGETSTRTLWREKRGGLMYQLFLYTPWVLWTIPTATYVFWTARDAGHSGAQVVPILALALAAAAWVLFGHTLPARRGRLTSTVVNVYFVGLVVFGFILMMFTDVFVVFAITGFFHAFLLRPWQAGIAGVLATSLSINGVTMQVLDSPSPDTVVQFLIIVAVQTVAIGAGIVLSVRGETEERRREALVQRLGDALRENAGLHAQLVAQARESGARDERQRLAREIHDTLAQGLAGIITQLQAAQQAGSGQHVDRALDLARSSLSEARRSLHELSPQELGQARLPEALAELADRWEQDAGIDAQVDVTGEQIPLSPVIEVSLFRVVQESLTNVAKHADATRVVVTLAYAGSEVLLEVRDDGRGFSGDGESQGQEQGQNGGFGLTSMRQRIRGIGGHVAVEGAPGEGVSVSVRVPAISAERKVGP